MPGNGSLKVRCRHCRKRALLRRRGLCVRCYYDPLVRLLYPPTHRHAGYRRELGTRLRCPPATPTDARPGSEEKIMVLMGRAERGEYLWHPGDKAKGS
jgi:hypothetical protein